LIKYCPIGTLNLSTVISVSLWWVGWCTWWWGISERVPPVRPDHTISTDDQCCTPGCQGLQNHWCSCQNWKGKRIDELVFNGGLWYMESNPGPRQITDEQLILSSSFATSLIRCHRVSATLILVSTKAPRAGGLRTFSTASTLTIHQPREHLPLGRDSEKLWFPSEQEVPGEIYQWVSLNYTRNYLICLQWYQALNFIMSIINGLGIIILY
jgi:hypothetical protein